MGLTSFIQNTLDQQKLPNAQLLNKGIRGILDRIPPSKVSFDYIRVSSLYDLCVRKFCLGYWSGQNIGGIFDAQSRIKMDCGTLLHAYFQNQVLGPLGILKGIWVNTKTNEKIEGYHPDPEYIYRDTPTDIPEWILEEYTLYDEKYRIKGHVDGIVNLARLDALEEISKFSPDEIMEKIYTIQDEDRMAVLEIKTVNTYAFDSVQRTQMPPVYYQSQASVYQKLAGLDKTLFLYLSRDSADLFSFVYNYQEKWYNDAKLKAKIIWSSIRDKAIPDLLLVCQKPTDKPAVVCPFSQECFAKGLDYSAYIEKCISDQPDRNWLDLSTWEG